MSNGKGDKNRSIGKKYSKNYELINWGERKSTPIPRTKSVKKTKT